MAWIRNSSREADVLIRERTWELLEKDPENVIAKTIQRALVVRSHFKPIPIPDSGGKAYMPACHDLAHAFARVFSLRAVDGEHAFISERTASPSWRKKSGTCILSTYVHSWVEADLSSGKAVIIDLFPDQNESILPIVVEAPHPAYWLTADKDFLAELKKLQTEEFRKKVSEVEAEIRALAKEHDLL